MKKENSLLLAMIMAGCIITGKICGQSTATYEGINQVILKLKNEPALNKATTNFNQQLTGHIAIDAVNAKFGAMETKKISWGKNQESIFVIKFPAGTNIMELVDVYGKMEGVEYAEPDYKLQGTEVQTTSPNDKYYYRQWALKNNGTFLTSAISGADIDMERAWAIEKGDTGIIVGIIDSGCKLDHPEFAGRIWKNYEEIPNNGLDDDNNGYKDDTNGWDFANNDNDPTDDYGHGTNVTGIIGATGNNTIGYSGVDWNCKLMIIKSIDDLDGGSYSWIAGGIYYAVNNGARVINLSVAGKIASTTLQNAVAYAIANGVAVVASMGNSNSGIKEYPAGLPNVIAVGAAGYDDRRANFGGSTSGSNYGSHISVVAPGLFIYGLDYLSNTNYAKYSSGTSQASPHVAGLVSLLLAQNHARTPAQLKSIIESTAEDQVGSVSEDTPGWDQYYGYGRINAYQALLVASAVGFSDDAMETSSFLAYPNPAASGNINIVLAGVPEHPAILTLMNTLGQEVLKEELFFQKNTITKNIPAGVYFITILQNDITQTERLVVQE